MHVQIGNGHPVTANRVLAMLSTMFAFGAARGLLPDDMTNPARRIEKFKESPRERFLTTEEFERLGAALREAETVGVPWTVDESRPNAKHVPKERAGGVVFGYCAGNDVSVRDWQMQTAQWVLGKSFDTHAPIGPWIVTADEM